MVQLHIMSKELTRPGVVQSLAHAGYAFLSAGTVAEALGVDIAQLNALRGTWSRLLRDPYMRDGGRYRWRRHSCFEQDTESKGLLPVPHRPHWQSTSYNALHGGLERWFQPIEAEVTGTAVWTRLVSSLGALFARVKSVERWFIEAHQFRIDTESGIGRPTPEGAHRDGVDFVALILVERHGIRGGETRVFDTAETSGVRFTMAEPWSMLLLDDTRVVHETTPVQPDGVQGFRDTLVLTYRAGGFQAPDQTSEPEE